MQYALGENGETAPADGWSEDIPTGTEVGTYYVWYKVVGDEHHSDSEPVHVVVEIKEAGGGSGSGDGSSGGGGSSTPSTPSTENCTIPVENESTVQVGAKITEGTATVNEITDSVIEQATKTTGEATTENLTIDLSGAKQEVQAVELTKNTVDTLAETAASTENDISTVTVALTNASVEFDAEALDAISKESQTGEKVTIAVEEKESTDLEESQQTALEGKEVEKVISASVTSGSTEISSFGDGSVKMTVNNEIKDNRDKNYFHVYYLDALGNLIRHITEHTGLQALFRTGHFSDYVIIYDETDQNENIAPISGAVIENLTYTGSEQAVKIDSVNALAVDKDKTSVPADAYTISGDTKVTNAGTYKLIITAKEDSGYRGSTEVEYTVNKADQKMTVKTKNVKVKSGTKKIKPKKVFKVSDAIGKVTYKKLDGDKKISISKKGKIKLKKAKKGTYTMTVLVSSAGDENHNPGSETVEITIKVK